MDLPNSVYLETDDEAERLLTLLWHNHQITNFNVNFDKLNPHNAKAIKTFLDARGKNYVFVSRSAFSCCYGCGVVIDKDNPKPNSLLIEKKFIFCLIFKIQKLTYCPSSGGFCYRLPNLLTARPLSYEPEVLWFL